MDTLFTDKLAAGFKEFKKDILACFGCAEDDALPGRPSTPRHGSTGGSQEPRSSQAATSTLRVEPSADTPSQAAPFAPETTHPQADGNNVTRSASAAPTPPGSPSKRLPKIQEGTEVTSDSSGHSRATSAASEGVGKGCPILTKGTTAPLSDRSVSPEPAPHVSFKQGGNTNPPGQKSTLREILAATDILASIERQPSMGTVLSRIHERRGGAEVALSTQGTGETYTGILERQNENRPTTVKERIEKGKAAHQKGAGVGAAAYLKPKKASANQATAR